MTPSNVIHVDFKTKRWTTEARERELMAAIDRAMLSESADRLIEHFTEPTKLRNFKWDESPSVEPPPKPPSFKSIYLGDKDDQES